MEGQIMKKKIVSLFLAFCAITAVAATNPAYEVYAESAGESEAEDFYDGGSGTEEDPYQIASVESLLTFASNVNDGSRGGYAGTYFLLTEDMDLSGVSWSPIGNMDDMETHSTLFLGSFDGGDHTISNLDYESGEYHCGAGLFGVSCGEVKNLTLTDATVKITDGTSLAIGGAVGYNMGSVDHVTVENASITGNNCTGGVVGGNNSSVSNCNAENVTVEVIGDNQFEENHIVQADVAECGGLIIGGGFGGTIDNCNASGTVKA